MSKWGTKTVRRKASIVRSNKLKVKRDKGRFRLRLRLRNGKGVKRKMG